MTEYALYRGDTFVDIGTIDYLSKKYHMTKEYLHWSTFPSAHKRNVTGQMTLLYKFEDNDE